MTCFCEYDYTPSFFREAWHRSKKDHKCCECERQITPGQEYQRVSGVWEGRFLTFKSCERCADLREALAETLCTTFGELKNEYLEYLDFLPPVERDQTYSRVFGERK